MLDALEGIDRSIVLFVNGWHNSFFDSLFWILSKTWIWLPYYLLLLYLVKKHFTWKQTLTFILLALAMVAIVDSSTTFLFKETVQRYRPAHHAWLTNKLHFHQFDDGSFYKGGQYGFFSSHASNNAAIAFFAWMVLRTYYKKLGVWLILVVSLIGLSRIYLGVHYLSDIVAGVLWGVLGGFITFKLFTKLQNWFK